eukprot:GHRQ01024825.1.p1 GENE.GHRQ01024825.1~~GHRQ01024825.1.p1  ORF type:complete len:100 (-),score=38.77 GHRQ01024825.1:648-947(-)
MSTSVAPSSCLHTTHLPAQQALRKRAAEEGCEVVVVSAKVESELNGMPDEEAKEWLEMLGVEAGEGGGLGALIRATYKALGLQTYFTSGERLLVRGAAE